MRKKIVWLPYDFDTAIGINNEGQLVFPYNLEDIDQVSSANVFNGQDSVLWVNMRAAFFEEMKEMYQTLRSSGALSYALVEQMFEQHQAKWPEAIFNEDAYFKYLLPLIDDNDGSYLEMLLGSKAEQRKWWLYNRFRYIDSKYNAGDALTDYITIRGYAKSNVTVIPYADIYATVKYGSYLVQQRAERNHSYTLVCPLDVLNDTEIYIYSASQLASVGDLSGFKPGYADFSMATKLQSLKVGDSDVSYSNDNLTALYLGNNVLLRSVDARNCGNLSMPINLSGCSNIEHVYFTGTAITGITLPNGGILKTLALPGTITNLTIRNQSAITTFTMPSYSNITTLRIENVSSVVPTYTILNALAANSRVRLIGFDWDLETYSAASTLYDRLDAMRGLDENGGNVDTAQVMGTIHVDNITGSQLASLQERYPDITVTYDHIVSSLYYYNFEGTTLLYTETIQDGGDGAYSGTPSHASDARYTYTFAGWALTSFSTTANPNARTAVTADRSVYAAYTLVGQMYTVRFYNASTLLQTVNNVPYGGSATYTGATPVHPTSPGDMAFVGWSPLPSAITGNTDCYAQWVDTSSPLVQYLRGTMVNYASNTATAIGEYAFYYYDSLETVVTSAATIDQYAFSYCKNLKTVDLTATGQVSIGARAFNECNSLECLIIRSTAGVATIASTTLPVEPFYKLAVIYVPSSLVASYKSASYWSTYRDRIFSIDDYPVNLDTITDTWAQIIAASGDGTYSSKYNIGDTKSLAVGNTTVVMELIAKDLDVKTSGGTANMTWLTKYIYFNKKMFDSGNGAWDTSDLKAWIEGNDVFGSLPQELQSAIVPVDKTYYDSQSSSTKTTSCTIFIPSSRELCLTGNYLKEDSGIQYSVFDNYAKRIRWSYTSTRTWWTRSQSSTYYMVSIDSSGYADTSGRTSSYGVVFGFCI